VEAELARRGWTLERVGAAAYGCTQGGWRARKGGITRGGYRLEHVVEQVNEHEAWEAEQGMTTQPQLKSLFPYPGGKSRIAPAVHARMGRVVNRVEPFAGTAVWALSAPQDGATVTINDADGFITNCYRAIAADPDAVARWVDWPVSELDLHARHRWLVDRRDGLEARLRRDPNYSDPQIAGWWLWGICQWIGDEWCPRPPPGVAKVGDLVVQIPHLGDTGMGVHRASDAHPLPEQLPHLGNAGRGVHRLLVAYAERLRRARIACGDWRRVLGPSVTERHGLTAIFLDPPYQTGEHAMRYAGGGDVWEAAWAWALEHGDNPRLRIAICGYDDGRAAPDGWQVLRWKARGGYGSQGNGRGRANAGRETIWFSPHCLNPAEEARDALLRPISAKAVADMGPLFEDAA
jgi:hypothetical protein